MDHPSAPTTITLPSGLLACSHPKCSTLTFRTAPGIAVHFGNVHTVPYGSGLTVQAIESRIIDWDPVLEAKLNDALEAAKKRVGQIAEIVDAREKLGGNSQTQLKRSVKQKREFVDKKAQTKRLPSKNQTPSESSKSVLVESIEPAADKSSNNQNPLPPTQFIDDSQWAAGNKMSKLPQQPTTTTRKQSHQTRNQSQQTTTTTTRKPKSSYTTSTATKSTNWRRRPTPRNSDDTPRTTCTTSVRPTTPTKTIPVLCRGLSIPSPSIPPLWPEPVAPQKRVETLMDSKWAH